MREMGVDPDVIAKEILKQIRAKADDGKLKMKANSKDVRDALDKMRNKEGMLKSDDEYTKFVLENSNEEKERILRFI